MDLRGPSLGLVGPSIESERTLPRSYRPALDLIGPSLARHLLGYFATRDLLGGGGR